jgi:hypothetical protein
MVAYPGEGGPEVRKEQRRWLEEVRNVASMGPMRSASPS